MKETLINIFSDPVGTCGAVFLYCAVAIITVFVAEYAFGLQPCVLCLYERIPYFIAGALSVCGLATLYKEEWIPYASIIIFLCAIVFTVSGLIAFYHVGVEQHWWKSAVEGCAVNFDSDNIEDLRAMFDHKPAARCDEVAWADPILHISMAGYNMIFSFFMAGACGFSAVTIRRRFT